MYKRRISQYAFGQQQDGVENTNMKKKYNGLLSSKHMVFLFNYLRFSILFIHV